ncbi:hypothetical protein HC031_00920 [Planosporangium thailandense]|uniref:HD-CE domain-containing protein n=1 Tax=Planosporangium thailandense TaxID=765197 RepID=A0ABX0XQX9_9ACTN|nr:hypothetical protein [Planosporangium thailandense]NJC68287.1 hypothetical protein [Planosporangium thailandense]
MAARRGSRTLWDVLKGASAANLATVEHLVAHADPLLARVVETFPTYTLHDRRHAENVRVLMEKLLGDQLAKVSQLEAAMLILAAHFHDLGMVYTPAELDAVTAEKEFESFLAAEPEAYVAYRENGDGPTPAVLEWYCRWRHADRVRDMLARVPDDRLRWNGFSLREPLIRLCRSHNLDAAELRGPEFDPISFNDHCDLRFCAVLLRLADILDFDATRSPRSVYDHLGLARRETSHRAVSDDEWLKHLSAGGFHFPDPRRPNYQLGFSAHPDRPAVEHAVRAFLDVVEEELQRCRVLLGFCPQWRELDLPAGVDRANIHGEGYVYGQFRFELDREAVLDLFMGEQLYSNPYAFLRELLQNAIDAVRLCGELHGQPPAGDEPRIDVTYWEDEAGYLWVRFDDSGMGMDEDAVRRFFLKVGRSYYRSPEFRAEVLRAGGRASGFTPISRFGIGVLSCFLVGDAVEVSTLRAGAGGAVGEPVRLSIKRDDEFFVLQKGEMAPDPMPSRFGWEKGYRDRPGTSIAVRVDPGRSVVEAAELVPRLDGYLFAPPVPVFANGDRLSRATTDVLRRPSLDRPVEVCTHGQPEMAADLRYLGPVRLVALPLDLTSASATPLLSGQLVAVVATVPQEPDNDAYSDLLAGWPADVISEVDPEIRALLGRCVRGYWLTFDPFWMATPLKVRVTRDLDRELLDRVRALMPEYVDRADLNRPRGSGSDRPSGSYRPGRDGVVDWRTFLLELLSGLELRPDAYPGYISPCELDGPEVRSFLAAMRQRYNATAWGHNGIALPAPSFQRVGDSPSGVTLSLTGAVGLTDRLRPDLDVARERILALPFALNSALHLAVRRAVLRSPASLPADIVSELMVTELSAAPAVSPSLREMLDDPLVTQGEWRDEAVIATPAGRVSAAALRASAAVGKRWQVSAHRSGPLPSNYLYPMKWQDFGRREYEFSFYELVTRALVQTELDLEVPPDGGTGHAVWFRFRSVERPPLPPGLLRFPPLFFLPYAGPEEVLMWQGYPVNLRHPLAAWLVNHADSLAGELPAVFRQLRELLWRAGPDDEVNAVLERVARVRPDLRPPEAAYLRGGRDENAWWSR